MKFPSFELAPYNININCIGPGFYKTDLARPLFETPEWLPRWMEGKERGIVKLKMKTA